MLYPRRCAVPDADGRPGTRLGASEQGQAIPTATILLPLFFCPHSSAPILLPLFRDQTSELAVAAFRIEQWRLSSGSHTL